MTVCPKTLWASFLHHNETVHKVRRNTDQDVWRYPVRKIVHPEIRRKVDLYICWYKPFGLLSILLASLMRNYFPKRPSGALIHTLSKLYDVPVGFLTPPPPFWGCVLLYSWSPKGGCCSISDDLSCSLTFWPKVWNVAPSLHLPFEYEVRSLDIEEFMIAIALKIMVCLLVIMTLTFKQVNWNSMCASLSCCSTKSKMFQ